MNTIPATMKEHFLTFLPFVPLVLKLVFFSCVGRHSLVLLKHEEDIFMMDVGCTPF
jgi:hypothetical protein